MYSTSRFFGSSVSVRTFSPLRLFTIDLNDWPKSVLTQMYGLKSFRRWLSTVTYTVPASYFDGTTSLTNDPAGKPGMFFVMFVHVFPSFETYTKPSSLPV